MDYPSYSMMVGRHDGDALWAEGSLGFTGATMGGADGGGAGSLSFQDNDDIDDDAAVALPHLQGRPTYDDVDPLPSSLTPTRHYYPGTNSHHHHHHHQQGWLAPPLTPGRDSRDDGGNDVAVGNGAASSREGSSVRGGAGSSVHRGGGESSRATSPRESAGSRNGSRASVFARKLACRQS